MQLGTWRAVAGGEHALVVAPTGSGKTLAAFLHAIDRLASEKRAAAGTRVLYVSPVKALAADVRKNLEAPLAGIAARQADADRDSGAGTDPGTSPSSGSGTADDLGPGDSRTTVSVGMRTGDTPPAERARLVRRPPDILVTTPESLYLMLTSRARDTLRTVDTVIVDEVHAVAGTKRGSHLSLSLERLDDLLERPARRIGLSATVSPLDTVAAFLGGSAPVTIVQPAAERVPDMRIVVPVPDLDDIAGAGSGDATAHASAAGDERTGSIWPHIEASVLDSVLAHRSTIVFVNSRGLAEKLTAQLNALHADRLDAAHPKVLHSATGPTTNRSARRHGAASEDGPASDEPAITAPGESTVIARSHHGSVSKEQRKLVEDDLKSGSLRCVVATSSLELGIDMGDVDLVIQIAAPPDVASGLQRVGRANHRVGATASGLVFPRTRRDLLESAVIVERMERGLLEPLSPPANPLDVLAQHTVSATALEDVELDAWWATVRRAHPFRRLSRASFESVIGMLAGRWSSEAFTDMRPRLVWDRDAGTLTARSGAQRLATTNAGTIPDRGAYSVVLPEGAEAAGARRVGELDEEMVHESRVGDVITLGAGSWLVQEISTDRVTVVPAPGRSARLPFWHGEGPGRPMALGEAIGGFARAIADAADHPGPSLGGPPRPGPDRVTSNLQSFVSAQRDATGVVPSDTDLVLEICPEETGDLRLILHSPYGRRVHAPWALAIDERLRERFGGSAAVMAADDGIVARIPAEDADGTDIDPALFAFDPDVLSQRVERLVGGSALFAARFRECAARALLLPRRDPGRRTPLWQQRLRAGRLLEAVAEFPDFPILIETARECLEDVYDLAGLRRLMAGIREESVRVHVAHTAVPSPFAGDLLFGYVGEFLYEGDRPLAEQRASVLALDPAVLADLVGREDAGELLDPALIAEVEAELQRTLPGRRARGVEGVADLLRELGPLTAAEVAARWEVDARSEDTDRSEDTGKPENAARAKTSGPAHTDAVAEESAEALDALAAAGRAVVASRTSGATPLWAAVEDAGRLRAVMGPSAVRMGTSATGAGQQDRSDRKIPDEHLDSGPDPLRDLVVRRARTCGVVTADDLAERFAVGHALVLPLLERLDGEGVLIATASGWMHTDVFARVRRRGLQAARAATRPVPARAYARLLAERHALGGRRHGTSGLVRALEQLSGAALPASLWESQILTARVGDFSPHLLDDLVAAREVVWTPADASADTVPDPLIALPLAELADESLHADDGSDLSELQRAILDVLAAGGAWTAEEISARATAQSPAPPPAHSPAVPPTPDGLRTALWGLARRGLVTTDSLAPVRGAADAAPAGGRERSVRGLRAGGSAGSANRRSRGRSGRTRGTGRRPRLREVGADSELFGSSYGSAYRSLAPTAVDMPDPRVRGRWTAAAVDRMGPTERALGLVEALLDRYGVVSRDAAVAEAVPGGFSVVHRICARLEEAGHVVRGHFVDGLGGAQFAEPSTVDRLRDLASSSAVGSVRSAGSVLPPSPAGAAPSGGPVVVSAVDPANPYGRMLPWPPGTGEGSRPDGPGVTRPSRSAGALVVLDDGEVRAWLSRGGRTLLTFASADEARTPRAEADAPDTARTADAANDSITDETRQHAEALVAFLRRSGAADLTLETIDGVSTYRHPWSTALQDAGLSVTPRGLRFHRRA
ncbi:ATP-dependent helicase Lhr and Lhr-like helicase [Brevibacterium sp. Mu109]|uniref:Lhr family helicase n=1 Tax=Brevibacterium sp. Mu109 TaxID=1255669 RepID=UPI000C3C9AD2|nr:DEAD/DEAH box helicase [Brevibacterium sp. Mu109]SMX64947.1 ATP-dependent helicase Lhr and Lhr-like helicase [Brevibacterium sp. Mu109]